MSFKVYNKAGKRSYKETRLVNKLNSVINQRIQSNPNFINEYEPANNFAELQSLHDKICVEDIQFQEVQPKNNDNNMANEVEEKVEESKSNFTDFENEDNSFIDPLNREEPVVRDYVMNEEFPNAEKTAKGKRTTFDEPISFEESFELPSDDEEEQPQQQQKGQRQQKQQRQPQEPLNPSFDEMSNGKKKRSTKKMAKYIVEVVCTLAEKGFVWFANKDINETKLAEYEISGEIDLSLMLSLEDGQEATVKEFFLVQAMRAEQLSKISQEERNDLAEALAEVMLEKGIAPTPMQELILIGVGIFGKQALTLWQISSQNNAVLMQLRALRVETKQPQPVQQPIPQPQPVAQPIQEEIRVEKVMEQPKPILKEEYSYEESLILDKPINTIE
jgi:hypothetical protein